MSVIDKDAVNSPHNKDLALPAGVASDESVSQQRRKLIKASAAVVPAVMTLRSGAAAAMGSTYGCTAHDNKVAMQEITTPEDFVLIPPHDHWIRIRGKRLTRGNVVIYCTMTGPGEMNTADAWQCFDESGNEVTGTVPLNLITGGEDVLLLAFLNFDEWGNDTGDPVQWFPMIRTVTEAPPGRSPLTGSCLASIHPNLILPG